MVAQKEKEKQKEGGPHDARSTLTIKRLTKKFRFLPIHSTASPHFARLPNEILELVFDALDQQGLHATLANFQQSSKHTYAMATPYLFRTIIVSPTTIECLLPLNATVSSGEEDYTMEDLRRYNSIMGHSHLTPRSSDRSDRSNSEDPGSDRDPDESESEDDRSDNEVVKKERPRITPPPSGEITTLNQVGTKATPYELYHAIRSGTKMRGADPNDFSPDDSHVYKAAHLVHVRRIHMAPGLDQGILQRFSGYLRDVTDGIECPMPALQQVCFVPTIWQKTPSQSWRRRSRRRAKLEPTEGPGQFLAIAFRGRKQPKGPHMCFHLSSKTNPEGVKYDGAYFEDITMFKPAPASITFHGVHKQTYHDAMNFANRKVGCHRYIFAKNPNTEKYSPMTSMADVAIEIIHQLSNRQKESVGKRLRLGNFRVEALNVFLTEAEKEKSADVRAAVRAQVEGGQHRIMDNKIISDVLDHFEYEPVLLPGRKLKKKERALWRPCDACGHPP